MEIASRRNEERERERAGEKERSTKACEDRIPTQRTLASGQKF